VRLTDGSNARVRAGPDPTLSTGQVVTAARWRSMLTDVASTKTIRDDIVKPRHDAAPGERVYRTPQGRQALPDVGAPGGISWSSATQPTRCVSCCRS
jgi:hypothetical protein